jgi:hypothetical protein
MYCARAIQDEEGGSLLLPSIVRSTTWAVPTPNCPIESWVTARHGLMTVSRQFAHIIIHVLWKSVRVHHVVAWVPDGAQSVNILLLPFCMWFSIVSPMMQASS